MVSHCGCDLYFLMISDVEYLFVYLLVVHWYVFTGDTSVQVLCRLLGWIFCCCVVGVLYVFCILIPYPIVALAHSFSSLSVGWHSTLLIVSFDG